MPIPVPVTKTQVASAIWGIPMTNTVNGLMAPRIVAAKQLSVSMAGLAAGTWYNVSGMSFGYVTKANYNYGLYWSCNVAPASTGLWLSSGVAVDGATLPSRFSGAMASAAVSNYGLDVRGFGFISTLTGGLFTAINHTFQLMVTSAGGNISVTTSSPCWIVLVEMGTEVW